MRLPTAPEQCIRVPLYLYPRVSLGFGHHLHLCLITCSKVLGLDTLRFLMYVAHHIIHCILIALVCESHEAMLGPNIILTVLVLTTEIPS
jgi:hypothetical protein